jgi:hypothetical protein
MSYVYEGTVKPGTIAVWNLLQGGVEINRILQVAVGKGKIKTAEGWRERYCYIIKTAVSRQHINFT